MIKDLPLKLKNFGCYQTTEEGVFFYTEHNFKIFVSKEMIETINIIHFKQEVLKNEK